MPDLDPGSERRSADGAAAFADRSEGAPRLSTGVLSVHGYAEKSAKKREGAMPIAPSEVEAEIGPFDEAHELRRGPSSVGDIRQ